MRIAIIGTGIAGLGAAHKLHASHELTLYESSSWVGGHSHTVDVDLDGSSRPIDTGFIVYNETTYPLLTALFSDLKVDTEPSNMSFAIAGGPAEYEGSLRGIVSSPGALLSPKHWQMVRDILRFNRRIRDTDIDDPELLLSGLIAPYSNAFRDRYLFPMGAAIWSTPESDLGEYPAAAFARFFRNHGLVQLKDRPQWRTVTGGSRQYVAKRISPFQDRIRTNEPVTNAVRSSDGVDVSSRSGRDRFDRVIFATHADSALALLGSDATEQEQAILGSFRYSQNRAVLHTDERFMARRRRAWASWNVMAGGRDRAPCVSYWMNRLQNFEHQPPVFVTLNPPFEPSGHLGEWQYDHPLFDRAAIVAQTQLPSLQGRRNSFFCGAYTRHGFHEDGLMSGYAAAQAVTDRLVAV